MDDRARNRKASKKAIIAQGYKRQEIIALYEGTREIVEETLHRQGLAVAQVFIYPQEQSYITYNQIKKHCDQ